MKKNLFFLFILFTAFIQQTGKAQILYRAWSVLDGAESIDIGFDIVESSNGGFVVVGASSSSLNAFAGNHGGADIYLASFNANGQKQWMKLLGGTQNDVGTSIIRKANGSLYIAGRTKSSDFDFSSNVGAYDYFLMKLDASGNLIWSKTYGGSDEDIGAHLIELNDGFLLTGTSLSNDSLAGPVCYGFADYWLIKTDTAGNVQWTKRTGGSDWERYATSTLMSNGKIFTLGSTSSYDYDVSVNYGPEDMWLNQFSAVTGSLLAELSIGGPITEQGIEVVEDNAGNYYVCGNTTSTSNISASNHGGLDYYITKFNSAGTRLWSKCYGGLSGDHLGDVQYKNGALYLCGTSNSNDGDIINYFGAEDIWLIKIDTAGTILNNFMFGRENTDEGLKVLVLNNNDIIVLGLTLSGNLDKTPTAGLNDILLIKIGWSPAGLQEQPLSALSVVPNPSNGLFHLQHWQQQAYSVFDISGKCVLQDNSPNIDIRHLQAGLYFLTCGSSTIKLVKTTD